MSQYREVLERLLELENEFYPPRENAGPYRIVDGSSPLILSAPHAVQHVRDGHPKSPDFLTGPLALVLAERLRATAIVSTYSTGDPNWDPDSPYRQALTALVQDRPDAVVVDLHGADDEYGFGLALGTASWARRWPLESLSHVRVRMEAGLGEPVWLNGPFFQAGDRTLTAHVVGVCRRPAVQMEIARRLRRPVRRPEGVVKLIAAVDLLCRELIHGFKVDGSELKAQGSAFKGRGTAADP